MKQLILILIFLFLATASKADDQAWAREQIAQFVQTAQQLKLIALPSPPNQLNTNVLLEFNRVDQSHGSFYSGRQVQLNFSPQTLALRDETILAHELGHAISFNMYSQRVNEGFGDVIAYLLTGKTYVGTPGFYQNFIRQNRSVAPSEVAASTGRPFREVIDSENDRGRAAAFVRNARTLVDMPDTVRGGGVDAHVASQLISRFLVDLARDPNFQNSFFGSFVSTYRLLSLGYRRPSLKVEKLFEGVSGSIKPLIAQRFPSRVAYRDECYDALVDFHIVAAIFYQVSPTSAQALIREKFEARGGDLRVFDRLLTLLPVR